MELTEEQKSLIENIKNGVVEQLKAELPLRKELLNGAKSARVELKEKKEKMAEYIKAVYSKDLPRIKSLSEGTAADGGDFVPEYFSSEVIRIAGVYGVARRNARVVRVKGNLKIPTSGAVTAYRVDEKAKIGASKPTIGNVKIELQKVAAMIIMTDELLKDADVNVIDLITSLAGEAIAKLEDQWAFLGLGAGEGLFQDTNVQVVTMGSGSDAYTDATFDDLLDLTSKVDEGVLAGSKFYMSFSMLNVFRKLKYASGTASYIFQEPGSGQPATIWNFPVELVSVMPKATDVSQAAKKFVAFGNLNYMTFGDEGTMEVTISKDATVTDDDGNTTVSLFEQAMSAIRLIERIDIKLAMADKAFAVLKTATS